MLHLLSTTAPQHTHMSSLARIDESRALTAEEAAAAGPTLSGGVASAPRRTQSGASAGDTPGWTSASSSASSPAPAPLQRTASEKRKRAAFEYVDSDDSDDDSS